MTIKTMLLGTLTVPALVAASQAAGNANIARTGDRICITSNGLPGLFASPDHFSTPPRHQSELSRDFRR